MFWLTENIIIAVLAILAETYTATNLDVFEDSAAGSQHSDQAEPKTLTIFQKDIGLELLGCQYFENNKQLSTQLNLAAYKRHIYPQNQGFSELKKTFDSIKECSGTAVLSRRVSEFERASWLDSFSRHDAFIASPPPRNDKEANQFFNMVWNRNVRVIAVLGKTLEGQDSSFKYWPTEIGEVIHLPGAYEITAIEHKYYQKWHVCVLLNVRKVDANCARRVTHCLFTEWPDMVTPAQSDNMLQFWKYVKQLGAQWHPTPEVASGEVLPSPILVQDSGHSGRAITFIAIDVLIERMESEVGRPVDLMGVVIRLYLQRVSHMTNEQYDFCVSMLQRYETSRTIHQRDVSLELPDCPYFAHNKLLSTSSVLANYGRFIYPTHQEYFMLKNKYNSIKQCARVTLLPKHVLGYDNQANWIDSYSRRNAFIASAGPTNADEAHRFWDMVWIHDARVIAMLTREYEGDGTSNFKCSLYWPTQVNRREQFRLGVYEITATDRQIFEKCYECTLLVVRKVGEDSTRLVTHCLFVEWPDMGIPTNIDYFLLFWSHVKKLGAQSNSEIAGAEASPSPILVHGSIDTGRATTFIAIDVLIERMETEVGRPVDLMGVVLRLYLQQPAHMTKEQYDFCINVLQKYEEQALVRSIID